MKLRTACFSLWFLLGVPVLTALLFERDGQAPPPPSWDRGEPWNQAHHGSDSDRWQQVLSRLDALEQAQKSEHSKYGELENGLKSLRKDIARHSGGIARMDVFAETMLERLSALEDKQTGKRSRDWTVQGQATTESETSNNQTQKQSAEETSHVSDTDKASPQATGYPLTESQEEEEKKEEAPPVEATTVSPLCLTSSPPSRTAAEFNITVTDSGVVAKYTCKYGYFNIGGDDHVSKCDAEGKWSDVDISCNNFTTCSYRYGTRLVYGGTHSTTVKGRTCQKWSSYKPHAHRYANPIHFSRTTWLGPESLDDVANYCRDPGLLKGSGKLWCYTTDNRHRWEKCKVPECTTT